MPKLVNRAKMTTATTGTGTITLGSAVSGYQTFAAAGVADTNVVRYTIEDGSNWEIGSGTYTSAGTTLSRTPSESSNAGSAISLSGTATVFVTAAASDLQELVTFAETFALPTSDGTNGQVLTTNGSGALTFTTVGGGGGSLTGQTDSVSPFETSLGVGAGAVNTGTSNTFIGFESGNDNTTGTLNTAIGYQSLDVNTTGIRNVSVGAHSLGALTTGSNNTAVGHSALGALTTGGRNTALGINAMGLGVATATSGYNTAIGYSAGATITTGIENTLLGYAAGLNITTGSSNVLIGVTSGSTIQTGNNLIVIGHSAAPTDTSGSNEITLGNTSITNFRVPGVGFSFNTTSGAVVPKTITATGTTGAQTINKTAGSVNFAVAATDVVVTNSFVTSSSVIIATVGTNDVTMKSVAVVANSGSFTLYANAAPTAETRVNFLVVN